MDIILTVLATALALVFGYLYYQERRKVAAEVSASQVALQVQRKRLHREQNRLMNALDDAFLIIDPDGLILFANRTAGELVAGRILEGRSVQEVFLDSRVSDIINRAVTARESTTQRIVLPQQASLSSDATRHGETAWLIDAAPLDDDREYEITRVVIRDVTLELQTEQIRKDFVANASHELRTPLSIINGYLENLVDDGETDAVFLNRSLKIMQKHGDRIARIVDDMLVISRLESREEAALNREPFLLLECVQDVMDRLEPMITAQQARTKFAFESDDYLLLGDRFYWTQIFFNLIENALKQNPSAPIKLEVGARQKPDGSLLLWVKDNGIGIPGSDLPFIFRRFYRVEKHHNQNSIKGTGLGLSIVKRAVEAHDGEIMASSTPGSSTIFEMTLPKTISIQEATPPTASA